MVAILINLNINLKFYEYEKKTIFNSCAAANCVQRMGSIKHHHGVFHRRSELGQRVRLLLGW